MIETKKYIRKPLFVDAVRVTEENMSIVADWCQGELVSNGENASHIRVRVHNPKTPRQTKAYVGDWVLYTDRGYKVYLNKGFNNAFDLVDGDPEPVDEFSMDQIEEARENPDSVLPESMRPGFDILSVATSNQLDVPDGRP